MPSSATTPGGQRRKMHETMGQTNAVAARTQNSVKLLEKFNRNQSSNYILYGNEYENEET